MLHVYDRSLLWVLRHRPVMLIISVGVLVATGYLYVKVPKGFIPEADTDSIYVNSEAAQGTSFYKMFDYQKMIANVLIKDPNIDSFMFSVGGSNWGSSGSNQSRMYVELIPRRQREVSATELAQKLRPQLVRIPGVRGLVNVPQTIRIGSRSSRTAYEFTLQGPDTKELYREAQKVERLIAQLPEVLDVNSDLQIKMPRVGIEIDRDKAAALQLNVAQIQRTLYDAFGPQWSSTIYAPTNQYKVLLEMLPKYQRFADYMSKIYFKSSDDHLIPLNAVLQTKTDASPQTVNHSGQLPAVTIAFNLKPGVSLGEAVEEIEDLARNNLPATITTGFQGTAKMFQDSLKNLTLLLIIAVAVVYIVLGGAVRELSAPDHNPVRPAFCRLRRAPDAVHLQGGAQHLRIRGIDDVTGYRKEERHHADRFCGGRRTERFEDAAGGDLRRLPGALSADHDDHDGGSAGCRADGARVGIGRRSPASAGSLRRWRTVLLAVANPVFNAGGIHLSGGTFGEMEAVA
jgi:HAE1 family hydrophobic/amphiphilic exporter-1